MLQYRTNSGVRRKPSLGQFGELTVEQARSLAQDWLAEVRRGGDPGHDKSEARKALTVKDLCIRFIEDHSKLRNKPSMRKGYQYQIDTSLWLQEGPRGRPQRHHDAGEADGEVPHTGQPCPLPRPQDVQPSRTLGLPAGRLQSLPPCTQVPGKRLYSPHHRRAAAGRHRRTAGAGRAWGGPR